MLLERRGLGLPGKAMTERGGPFSRDGLIVGATSV
jgi:hypothetical protein